MNFWLKFVSPQNISGASYQTGLQHSPGDLKQALKTADLIPQIVSVKGRTWLITLSIAATFKWK